MTETIVLQSHADRVPAVIGRATASVRAWAEARGYAYRFMDDALFQHAPDWCLAKVGARRQMAADIARLGWISAELDAGWGRVVWMDADVFVFAPDVLDIHGIGDFAFGVEHWAQPDGKGGVKRHRNVHNAFMAFTPAGRTTLAFYHDTALRMLRDVAPTVPAQFVGPKLLTALDNVVRLPLFAGIGMASPLVLGDLAAGGGPAWDMVAAAHGPALGGVNLCSSMLGQRVDGIDIDETLFERAVAALARKG